MKAVGSIADNVPAKSNAYGSSPPAYLQRTHLV